MTAVYETEYSAIRSPCLWTSLCCATAPGILCREEVPCPGAGGEAGDGARGKETMPADARILGHVTLVNAEEEARVPRGRFGVHLDKARSGAGLWYGDGARSRRQNKGNRRVEMCTAGC